MTAVSPKGGRDHSPQPRSPCPGQAHSHSTISTAQSSMPSYSTATSILVSRTSLSPQNLYPGRPVAGASTNNSPVNTYPMADLCDRVVATLVDVGCAIHPMQLSDLLDGRCEPSATRAISDALDRFIDDLSGSNARRALAALLRAVPLCNMPPKPPALCAIATATFIEGTHSRTPRRNSSQGSLSGRFEPSSPNEPNRNPHSTLMRPSFANDADPQAHSGGTYVPPMSPFTFVNQQSAQISAHPSDAVSLHFKAKNRRESVESFTSTYIASKVRSVRSIERSVDADGYKMINDYTVLKPLGKGTSGKVKQVVHHESGECRAIKIVKRSMVKKLQWPHGIDRLRKEVAIMKKLNHKHIIQLFEVIDDPDSDKMYYVMQFAAKGEVLPGIDEILQYAEQPEQQSELLPVKCKPLPEEKVAKYVRQAASGLIYLHNHGVVHFDIKPQNILCDQDDNVVIADFGVSELMKSDADNMVESLGFGTPAFMAPEVCRGDRMVDGEAVDTWSLGVSAFAMLYAKMPFRGRSVRDMSANIQSLSVAYPIEATAIQRDFFAHIFVDASQRWSLRQLRKHPFLSTFSESLLMTASMADQSPMRGDEDALGASTLVHRQGFHHRAFSVTQIEMEAAISRLVSPVFGEMGEVISSSCSSESRSASISQDSYSRAQSPRTGPMPPAAPPGNFSASEIALPNPRGAMSRGVIEKETITPPLSRYSSIGSSAFDDAYRARRETQVMREASAGR
ncbi:protein kinase, putative [Bodo saltans]|uniref:Protein kinase, putative n=1 Tax=Bodo saltans TaxID=75058 RepID=A0A0S4IWM4_BODSA|nr:protein kinase, putative [Bodo saltans]|eukprot:CUG06366.1 protein kinase, putative [Bodo saltans]